jgi:hypothetical protein
LRQLIQGWRDAKKSALMAMIAWSVRSAVALLLIGLAYRLDLITRLKH